MHSVYATHPEGFNMEDIKIGKGSVSIWAIIAAVGGLLAFIALFLAITKWSYTVEIFGVETTTWGKSISGLDFLSNKYDGHDVDDAYTFWRLMPLFTALFGLATIVLGILPVFGVNNSGVKIAFMVCGIITLVCGILVFALTGGKAAFDADLDNYKFHRQIGAYFALFGGILAGAGACLDKFGVKI